MKLIPKTAEERRKAQCEATARWLAKPGNREKHRAAVARCRQVPKAREIHRKRQLKYAAKHRERERKRAADWRQSKPEEAKVSCRIYYLKNREKRIAAAKAYRAANKEAYLEYGRQYRASLNAGGRPSKGYVQRMMKEQNNLCRACACDLLITGHHVDHIIPIARGGLHCDSNVQLLCPTCNRRKSARSFDDFLMSLNRERAA